MLNKIHRLAPAAVIAALFLLAGFTLYGSAGHDDSHITFWASYTLKEFGEIVNYNGDRIEQSSSLLLTVVTALFAFIFQSDVVVAGYLITLLAGAAAIVMTWQLLQRMACSDNNISLIALVLLATSPAFLLWNTSGMESTLAALCVVCFVMAWADILSGKVALTSKSVAYASFITLCLTSVRPEMIPLVAATVFGVFIYRKITGLGSSVPTTVFYVTVLLCVCILVAFRLGYFGSPMPLPVSAKVSSFNIEKLRQGFYYVLTQGYSNIVFVIGVVIALIHLFRQVIKADKPDYYFLLCIFLLLAYTGFIIFSGGDWMQMGRFLVPVLPLAAVITTRHLQRSLKNPLLCLSITVAMIGLNINGNWIALKSKSHGIPIWASYYISPQHQQRYSLFEQYNQEHLRDMDVIDRIDQTIEDLLAARINDNNKTVTLLSGQSGMVFFHTAKKYYSPSDKRVQFYDNRALVENSLLKCDLINDIARGSQGLYFDFDGFFARQPALQNDCGIPEPDILYDINDMTRQLPQRMEANGYTLIHKEGGKMVSTKSGLPTNTLPAVNFVMVANDVVDDLNYPATTVTRYHEKPLIDR